MARPKQCRLVEMAPQIAGYTPYGRRCVSSQPISLRYDEYEAIRLLDYEGMQQAQAAEVMNVSRPTLTRIYDNARKSIAKALVEGLPIEITGGNTEFEQHIKQKIDFKIMNQKIAIPTAQGVLFPHFGKAPQVTVVTVTDGKVSDTQVFDGPAHEHGAMPRMIAKLECTDVICGGAGDAAIQMLNQMGIQVHAGAPQLAVEDIMLKYLNGTIEYGDGRCNHEGCGGHHHHHEGGCHHDN
ncbi:MAG: DUF134 domain-containing protein [Bacteroidaceae bacterium]|nr:DUF134 domain-containing protein [Bacteroidaceae bacterium]